jgi:hypothetical protein
MNTALGSDRPVGYLARFFDFFAFGVNGAGGEVSKRLSALSARFKASALTGGRASFSGLGICES